MNLSASRCRFQRLSQPSSPLACHDARRAARLLGAQDDADAASAGWFGQVLAAAYKAAECPPGALRAAVADHGALHVIRALDQSFTLTGRPPDDVATSAAALAAEAAVAGTWRLGAPLMDDEAMTDPVMPDCEPVTAIPATGRDEPSLPPVPGGSLGFDLADDYRGTISADELTPAEEDYRSRAHAAALHYARDYNMEVFPVWWMATDRACACRDGIACQSRGKHPADRGWPELATSDPEQAARWWRPLQPGEETTDWRPRANLGALTGGKYFLLDVDTDDGKSGDASLATLIGHYDNEDLLHTFMTETGGGGRHHVMVIPEGCEVRGSASALGDFLDLKGLRGFAILPPSVSGKGSYTLLADVAPAPPPGWLADWLREQHRRRTEKISAIPRPPDGDQRPLPATLTRRAQAYISGALADAARKVSQAADRTRNQTLNDQAWALFARFGPAGFLDPDDIAAAMQDAAEACGLRGAEIPRTIASACDGALRKPRDHELPDFLFGEEGGELTARPEPLADERRPWLPKDRGTAVTGLADGRVLLEGHGGKDSVPADVLRLAWAVALGCASPHVAVFGRDLVVVSGGEQGSLDISPLTPVRLRQLCAASGLTFTRHVRETDNGDGGTDVEKWDEDMLPSAQLCATVLADPAIRMYRPVLGGITKTPVLRPDGTLLEVQGIDAATSMIYWPDLPVGTIPAAPGRSEVAAAKKFILGELLADFPWHDDASKANAVAMLLTSYLEPYAGYLSPQFVVDAPKSGSGKTFLARILQETTGAHFRTWVNDEAEIRKALTSCLMESDRCIVFDDVGRKDIVASATLAGALTKRQWDDRVLGVSRNFRGTNNRTWCLNGNNVKLGGDIPSRSVLIRLNPGASDPKKRAVSEFVLGDLDVWLSQDQNKVAVIRALLVLITSWADHGCPRSGIQHRFAGWAAMVGGVLEFHGVGGFLANQAAVEELVHYDEHLADFYKRWFTLYESEPQQVTRLRQTLGKDPELGDGHVWMGTWPRDRRHSLVTAKGLARLLKDAIGEDHGGFQVSTTRDKHGHDLYSVSPIGVTESDQNPTTYG
jgi:hypothetical protein